MSSAVLGHSQDQKFPHVRINESLFADLQSLIPQGWRDWQFFCMGSRGHYGVPVQLPFAMGMVETASGRCKVFLEDGDQIMLRHDMDFTQGGNGYEDGKLCPRDVIVLDASIMFPMVMDLPLIAYHETSEGPGDGDGRSMAMGLSYDRAHVFANAKEHVLRRRGR